jgi:hypothetical protein
LQVICECSSRLLFSSIQWLTNLTAFSSLWWEQKWLQAWHLLIALSTLNYYTLKSLERQHW